MTWQYPSSERWTNLALSKTLSGTNTLHKRTFHANCFKYAGRN
jgi:hypothetical protein